MTRYIGVLCDLGVVEREVPVTEERPEKSRRGRYVLLDPFVRSWYRFVYANLSRLEMGDVSGVLAEAVAPNLHEYVSLHVERPVGALFWQGPLRSVVPFEPVFTGRYWSPGEEFDVVALVDLSAVGR
ncbi:MAG: hypothetical protein HY319_08310 [Armatimonadetes bacterium]|nr:hypothetical protein [Armatimonadota bacterium]